MGNATLRIGWELNGTWFAWSAKSNPADYANYWRHIVDAMRSVPGQNFRFVWSVSNGYYGWDPRAAYPGSGYVDFIGDGLYDAWYPHPATPQDRWNFLLYTNNPGGLAFWSTFAKNQGKPLALTEWGLVDANATMAGGSGGGGDDPYFVQQVYDWVQTHNVAFEVYFNTDAPDGRHRLDNGQFPTAATTYQTLFGASTTPPAQPTTPPANRPHRRRALTRQPPARPRGQPRQRSTTRSRGACPGAGAASPDTDTPAPRERCR